MYQSALPMFVFLSHLGHFVVQQKLILIQHCDLTEAEGIKKRWQEYTEELYKKHLNDPYDHNGVVTHLEPDILGCKVRWALGCIT